MKFHAPPFFAAHVRSTAGPRRAFAAAAPRAVASVCSGPIGADGAAPGELLRAWLGEIRSAATKPTRRFLLSPVWALWSAHTARIFSGPKPFLCFPAFLLLLFLSPALRLNADVAGPLPASVAEGVFFSPRSSPTPPSGAGPAPLFLGIARPTDTDKASDTGDPAVAEQAPEAVPFAGWELADIAAEMRKRHGESPTKWAEKMPGITSRLAVEPPAGKPTPATDLASALRNSVPPAPPVVALTLDACSGAYDAELIAFLRAQKIPATLFVAGPWLRRNPEAFTDLAADPLFEIAAHGNAHKPCSVNGREVYGIKGTASMAALVKEVEGNARDLHRAGASRPRWFRSATAFYDDVAVAVIHDLGMNIAGYSIAVDEGATLPPDRVRAKTLAAKNGDILLAHMNHPDSGTRKGLMEALPRLREKGFVFVRLSDREGALPPQTPPAGD